MFHAYFFFRKTAILFEKYLRTLNNSSLVIPRQASENSFFSPLCFCLIINKLFNYSDGITAK